MKPTKTAAIIAGCYLVPSLVYIFLSTRLTAYIAPSPEQAMLIELLKGSAFVVFSALLIFGVTWKALAIIGRRERERNQLNDALIQFDRRATTGLLAASIAHDAGNEIAVLAANLDALDAKTENDAELSDIVDDQRMALKRLNQLTDRLIDAAGATRSNGDYSPEELDLVARTRHIIDSLKQHCRLQDIEVSFQPSLQSCSLQASPGLLRQVLINLLFNAADAAHKGGKIEVQLHDDRDSVSVEVHDDGPGIDDEIRDQLFDAFFTTKAHGTGLGLFSVQACLSLQGGSIEVADSHLGGSVFRITLPKTPPEPNATSDLSRMVPSLSSSVNFAG